MDAENIQEAKKQEEPSAAPASPDHQFDFEKYYMFIWPHGACGPTIIVETPTIIYDDELLFHFAYGHASESKRVKKSEILAVGDEKGTVEVKGWIGKFTILNQALFDQCIQDGTARYAD